MNTVISFGRWVKDRRLALDLTQEALAERTGCSVDTIRKVASGTQRPSHQSPKYAESRVRSFLATHPA